MYAKFSNFINWSMTSWPPSFWLSHHHHHQQQQQHCPQRFIIIIGCLMTITAQTITNQSPIMAVMANNDHEEHVVINTPSFPQQNSIESPKLTHGNEVATKTFGLTSSTITNNHPKMTNLKFRSIFERMNGQQFIDIFDRLMNGKLSTIIEQIKANKNNRFDSIVPGKLSAIQLISLLDNFSSGEVSSNIASIIQSTKNRNRRSSFDSMTGLSIGYSKRGSRFDPMIGSTFGSPLKRGMNFDEMDHSGFAGFAKRRGSSSSATIDFDEMDNAGFAGFAKRLHNFDEIDRSGFSGFAKRSTDFNAIDHGRFAGGKRSHDIDFDEMDHSGFTNSFVKRLKESNIDEFDFDSKPINSNYRILLHQLLNRSNNRPYVGPFVLTTNNE